MGDDAAASVTPAQRKGIFLIISAVLFMASVDQTIVATALHVIQTDLDTGIQWSSWIITAYLLGQLLTMPIAGRVSDQFGRKRVLVAAIVLFTGASLCCGLATNIYVLVLLRAVQSIGAGAFMPASTGIISELWGADRDKAIGLFSSIFPIGGIAGPVLGGVITDVWSWRWIFLINVPIGVVACVGALLLVPSHRPQRTGRTDLLGIGLMGTSLLGGMFAMTYLGDPRHHPGSVWFLTPLAVGVLSGVLFFRHSHRARAPFIPPRFLDGPDFGRMNVINLLFGCAAAGFSALAPTFAQDRLGVSALAAGEMLVARSIGMVVAAAIAVKLLRRSGVRRPMILGYTVTAAGLFLTLPGEFLLSPLIWLTLGATLTGVGIGAAAPSSNNAGLQLSPDNAAALSGLRGMFRQVGGITAVSVATALAARSDSPATTLGWSFAVLAVLLLLTLPMIRKIPDHRGAW